MNGKVFDKKYYFKRIVRETPYYIDYKVWHDTWRKYIIVREIKNTYDKTDFLLKEAQTWIELGLHPNIVSAYFTKEINHKLCLFLEYQKGKNLSATSLQYSSESFPQILEIAIQISQAMLYLHDERILHKNLSLENIVFNEDGRVRVDNISWNFGHNAESIAKNLRPSFPQDPLSIGKESVYRKFAFLPPEYFLNPTYTWDENFAGDVYSFGMILYYVCCRSFPFYTEGDLKKVSSFYARKYEKEEIPSLKQKHSYISHEFADLVSLCLSVDAKKRPDFDTIKSELFNIYETYTGLNYITEYFQDTQLLSISLNNRALGELDNNNNNKAKTILQDVALLHTARISAALNLYLLKLRQNEITVRGFLSATQDLKYIDLKKVLLFQGYVCLEYGSFIQDILEELHKYPEINADLKILEGCLYYRMGYFNDAQRIFREQVKKDTVTQELWYFLGASLKAISSHEDSYTAWKEGLNYPLPYLDLLIAYGMTLTTRGNWSKAREYFEKSLQCDGLQSERSQNIWSHVRTFTTENNSSIIETKIAKDKEYISIRTIAGVDHIWAWPSGEKQQKVHQNIKLPLSRTGRIHQSFFGKNMSEIVFGQDKNIGISIHGDSIIKVWNLKTSRCLYELKEHSHAVTSLAITHNGKTFVSGSLDKTIKIWDIEKGICKTTLLGHEDCINCVDISKDGDIAISGSWDKTVRVWDVMNEKCIAIIKNHQGDITALSLSADGSIAVSGDSCGNLRILDVPKNKEIAFLEGERKTITGVALSQDKSLIVASFVNGTIRIFEDISHRDCPCWIKTPFILEKLDSPTSLEKRQQIAFWQNKAENFALNKKIDKAIDSYKKVLENSQDNIYLNALKNISFLTKQNSISSLGIENYKLLSIFYHENPIRDFLILNDECFFSISDTSRLCRWQISEKSCDIFWERNQYRMSCLIMANNRKTLCFGDDSNLIHIWYPEQDSWEVLEGHTGSITKLKMIKSHQEILLSSSTDGTIQLWNYQTKDPLGICYSEDYITDMILTKDYSVILTSTLSGCIYFWETKTQQLIMKSQQLSGSITSIAIPYFDQQTIASCGVDGCLKIWSMRSGSCNSIFKVGSGEALTSISVAKYKKIALIGSSKGKLYLWNFEEEKVILEIEAHTNSVVKVFLSEDGFIGYSAGKDGILKLWAFEWQF